MKRYLWNKDVGKNAFTGSKMYFTYKYVNVYVNRFIYVCGTFATILQISCAGMSEAVCMNSRGYLAKQWMKWIRMDRWKEKGRNDI